MKKFGIYGLFLVSLLFGAFYKNVYADEFKFSVHAEPSVVDAAGSQVKLKFIVSAGETVITSCKFKVSAPAGVTFVEDESPNGWNIDTGTKGYLLDSSDGVKEGVIMNSIYKVNSNSTITVSDIECGSVENDAVYPYEGEIKVDVKIADTVNIKVDGVAVSGKITNPLAASKTDFVLSVVSGDESVQSNVKVEIADTASGTKELCSGAECKEITVNFSSDNFCGSVECLAFKPSVGDNIQINVYVGSTLNKSFYVIKELTETETLDASLKYLKVWGHEIALVEGQTIYPLKVPANVSDYTVVAELSDPSNFVWDDEDNPSKYNFKTDTINLIIRPKNTEAVGAKEVVYVVVIEQDGESSSNNQSSGTVSGGNSSSANNNNNNNSNNNVSNPQTGGILQFIIAIILFVSLLATLTLYKKNMEEYK